ncbi:MAG: hypothetical protein DLM52_12400 [Chthoniobacterales bacterium]|nr:MAG: hypothetical protein DLM52_12400 [Chthoniobacterales bacterium]
MLWWIIVGGAVLLLAGWLFRRRWIAPWQELEQLVKQIARGEQPKTVLVSANHHAWRIGVALEDLLTRERALEQQLSQATSESRGIFAALTDAIIVVDAEQRVRFCNPAFEQLFAGRAVAPGERLLELTRDADIAENLRAVFDEQTARTVELTRSDKTFHLASVPMKNETGQLTGAIAIFHDISQLKQTDQIRRDFVANVSHELRTPLSIFRGNLEMLLDDGNLSREEADHIFTTMKRHSDRLNRVVEDLLTLARLEANEARLQLGPLDLIAFLQHVARDWNKRLAHKSLRLNLQVQENLPPVSADEFRLEQVMHNLLDNAVNYSPERGQIIISASARGEQIVLAVADEGPGIAPADLPRIFERFYRADKARSRALGSTGLGLSIVKHIAELHGGEVRAESELDKGTTIEVQLPIARS